MLVDAATVVAGGAVVALTVLSAIATVVVPRGVPVRLTRVVFLGVRRGFDLRVRLAKTYEAGESVMAWYAPITLFTLVFAWLILVGGGFTLVFHGLGVQPWPKAFELAGSSMTTLGFVGADTVPQHTAAFLDAAVGLLLVALLISYLPTIYGSFQRREALVARTAISAGSPPTGVDLLVRYHTIRGLDALPDQFWEPWTAGFIDIEETHTSTAALGFFRSPVPERNWVTAAGAVLDGAALLLSTVDADRQPEAALCIRAGYLSLRRIADFFDVPYDGAPAPGDPIQITREEWEAARARLGAAGVPLKEDVDQAWFDFAGWRVNYDEVLIVLAGLVMAPFAPWSSDRGSSRHRPGVRRRARRDA